MSQYKVLCDLLPHGRYFSKDNEDFHQELGCLGESLDAQKNLIEAMFCEVPGGLNTSLIRWTQFFGLDESRSQTGLNQEISGRLTAQGGQSKKYIENQLSACSQTPVTITAEPENYRLIIHGVCKTIPAKTGVKAGKKLMRYKRNESVVDRFLEIRHAETEARYY